MRPEVGRGGRVKRGDSGGGRSRGWGKVASNENHIQEWSHDAGPEKGSRRGLGGSQKLDKNN